MKRKSILGLFVAFCATLVLGIFSVAPTQTAQAEDGIHATKVEISTAVNSMYWEERAMALEVTFPNSGDNAFINLRDNLLPWAEGIVFNGDIFYSQSYNYLAGNNMDVGAYAGTYFAGSDLKTLKFWIRESEYKNTEINTLVLPAGLSLNGGKTAGETWYGRYGVWSTNINDLPAENDPNYVGTVESIEEPYGVVTPEMGGIYHRKIIVQFTLPAAYWGDGAKYVQEANDDRLGRTLYDLRRKVLVNGYPAVAESQMGSTWYYPDKANNWQTLNMVITDEHRDSHGYDTITFPELRLMDGRVIKETSFYYYYDIKQVNPDGSIIYDDIWHALPQDLEPSLSPVTAGGDVWKGKLTFARDCATVGAAFTQADKILFGTQAGAAVNASFEWTGTNELSYTVSKSAIASFDGLALTVKEGFVFPSEEVLRADYTKYYVASERFWITCTDEIVMDEFNLAHVASINKPVAQAGGAYQISVNFSGSLVADDTYVRMSNVTADMYTLYSRSLAQVPGYYYAQKGVYLNGYMTDTDGISIAEKVIRMGIRDSVLDNVKINGKSIRELLALETSEAIAKDCIQIDFHNNIMEIYITGDSANKITDVNGLILEIGAGVKFHSGRHTSQTVTYQFKNGTWKTYDPNSNNNNNNQDGPTAVDNVIALIDAIPGNITLADKATVMAAKNAYDALSATEKQGISKAKLNKLNEALTIIQALENPTSSSVADSSSGGCGSTVGLGLAAWTLVAAVVVTLRKKEN